MVESDWVLRYIYPDEYPLLHKVKENTMTDTGLPRERERKLRALAKLMNKQNDPSTFVSRELLYVFDAAITPEETDFLLAFGTDPRSREEAESLSRRNGGDRRNFFDGVLKKGLVWMRKTESGAETYSLAPILMGWFEVFLFGGEETPQHREFARRLDNLFTYWKQFNVFPVRNLRNLKQHFTGPENRIVAPASPARRTIAIHESEHVPEQRVLNERDVVSLIKKYGERSAIAVGHCFCRQWKKMVDEPCSFNMPNESCIAIGDFAEHIVRYNLGRRIPPAEAIDIVSKAGKRGAVHMVFHERENIGLPELGICSCCWDCCGVLGSYNRGITGLHFRAYYIAEMSNPDVCNGCGRCVRYCPVSAISIHEKKAEIHVKKCIGCGQCALQCPKNAVTISEKVRDVILPLLKKSEVRILR